MVNFPEINQCDGCRRGLPVKNGIHYGQGYDKIACTKDRYKTTTERKWLEELPILMVEPEPRSDALTEALPGMSELLESFEQLTMMKEQAK